MGQPCLPPERREGGKPLGTMVSDMPLAKLGRDAYAEAHIQSRGNGNSRRRNVRQECTRGLPPGPG